MARRHVCCEMRERHEILLLRSIVLHVGHVRQREMSHGIISDAVAGISNGWKVFCIAFPGFARCHEFPHDVVLRDREGSWCLAIIVG